MCYNGAIPKSGITSKGDKMLDYIESFSEVTSESKLESVLKDTFEQTEGVNWVSTFDERGLLTRDNGIVLRLENGAEFQITLVKSKSADLEPCEDCGKLTDDIVCEQCGGDE